MLTLQELKKCVTIPELNEKTPTTKQLRESGTVVAMEKLGKDTELGVYQNGYVFYRVGRHATVFPLYLCRDYLYVSGKNVICLAEKFFENERWSLRLMLEGEDRLNRNQDEKERRWNISCNAIVDRLIMEDDFIETVLERLTEQEMIDELSLFLTDRQKVIVWKYFFEKKTQRQISEELRVSKSAVSIILSKAVHRIRKNYSTHDITEGLNPRKKKSRCLESGEGNRDAGKRA